MSVASGFVFEDSNARSLLRAILTCFRTGPVLHVAVCNVSRLGVAMDFSWQVARSRTVSFTIA